MNSTRSARLRLRPTRTRQPAPPSSLHCPLGYVLAGTMSSSPTSTVGTAIAVRRGGWCARASAEKRCGVACDWTWPEVVASS
eukprot:465338-Pleurochrysis_carterae.AAC.1